MNVGSLFDRRSAIGLAAGGALALLSGKSVAARATARTAEAIYRAALVWDDHAGFGYAGPHDVALLDVWRTAGVGYLSVNVGYDVVPWDTTIKALSAYRREIAKRPDVVLATTVADVRAARDKRQLAVTFDLEGMVALNGDVGMVEVYHRLGVRQIAIAYNLNNAAGGGCHDNDSGLSEFGGAVIREMNRLGVVVDCSHSGIRTGLRAMEVSTRPCIFSHANSRVLREHERNITDEQIKACAATGGVIGVNGLSYYLAAGRGTVDDMARHVDHMVALVGPKHVGIGLDCDPGPPIPNAAFDPKFWPRRQYPDDGDFSYLPPSALLALTARLLEMGYDEPSLHAILGGNFMRVASQVWETA